MKLQSKIASWKASFPKATATTRGLQAPNGEMLKLVQLDDEFIKMFNGEEEVETLPEPDVTEPTPEADQTNEESKQKPKKKKKGVFGK
jgi:hypothetical protein